MFLLGSNNGNMGNTAFGLASNPYYLRYQFDNMSSLRVRLANKAATRHVQKTL